MIYLASPYSHPDPAIREERYQKALAAVAKYAQLKIAVYSPIVHWHCVAQRYELPMDAAFWAGLNETMLKRCSRLVVLAIDGWADSIGIKQEFAWAQEYDLAISFIKPDTL